MKNKSYVIRRDDVCVGKVIKIETGDKISLNKGYPYEEIRSILFVPTNDGLALANDLLYQDSKYPVMNMTDKDYCLDFVSNHEGYIVDQAYHLSQLLEIFDYPSWLTYKDIIDIRKIFFSGTFSQDHCVLFGYRAEMDGTFTYVGEGALPKEMFLLLDKMGNNRFLDVIFKGTRKNTFKASKEEGPIKKLSIF